MRTLDNDVAFRDPELSVSPDRRLALVEALVAGDSRDRGALAAVRSLRSDVVPTLFGRTDATVRVTGEAAEEIDYTDLMDFWLPRIIAFVLALSFVLLTRSPSDRSYSRFRLSR